MNDPTSMLVAKARKNCKKRIAQHSRCLAPYLVLGLRKPSTLTAGLMTYGLRIGVFGRWPGQNSFKMSRKLSIMSLEGKRLCEARATAGVPRLSGTISALRVWSGLGISVFNTSRLNGFWIQCCLFRGLGLRFQAVGNDFRDSRVIVTTTTTATTTPERP